MTTTPSSGKIGYSDINNSFNDGTDIKNYHNVTWYYPANLGYGSFSSTTLKSSDFYTKQPNDPATPGSITLTTAGSGTFTIPLYRHTLKIELWGAGGGGAVGPRGRAGPDAHRGSGGISRLRISVGGQLHPVQPRRARRAGRRRPLSRRQERRAGHRLHPLQRHRGSRGAGAGTAQAGVRALWRRTGGGRGFAGRGLGDGGGSRRGRRRRRGSAPAGVLSCYGRWSTAPGRAALKQTETAGYGQRRGGRRPVGR